VADESLLPSQDEVHTEPVSLLPEPDTRPQPRVPRNAEEVAAQASVALSGDFRSSLSTLRANGVEPLLTEVIRKELDDNTQAAREQALAFAKVGDAERAVWSARLAAAAGDSKHNADGSVDSVPAQKALASQALESLVGLDYINRTFKDQEQFDRVLQGASGMVAVRNMNALVGAGKPEPSLWDHAKHFFGSLIPFGYDARANQAIAKVIGGPVLRSPYESIQALRTHLLGLSGSERKATLEKLWEQDYGIWGDNLAAKVDFFRKVGELTKNEADVDVILNGLGLADVAALTKGLYAMVRHGTPLKAVADVAGERKAGQVVADELLNKAGYSGLNDAELMSRALSMGEIPGVVDPAATRGLAAAAQEKLANDWNTLLEGVRARLNSSGMAPDEIASNAERLRASLMQNPNKALHEVVFGEASADGQQLTILWKTKGGRYFSSEAAANKTIAADGLEGAVAVRLSDVESSVPKNGSLKHTASQDVNMLMLDKQLGILIKEGDNFLQLLNREAAKQGSKVRDDWFSAMRSEYAGDNFAQETINLFEKATKAGHDTVSAAHLLTLLRRHAEDPDILLIAQVLDNPAISWKKIPVKIRELRENGNYVPTRDEVNLSRSSFGSPELMLHELTHAHNAQVIAVALKGTTSEQRWLTKEQIAASKELETLWTKLKGVHKGKWEKFLDSPEGSIWQETKHVGEPHPYQILDAALEHPAELLAYGVSNPEVMSFLKATKLKDLGYKGSERSVFSELWNLFKQVLGFSGKDDHALAKLTSIFERFTKDIDEAERNVFKNLRNFDNASTDHLLDLFQHTGKAKKEQWVIKQTRTDPLSYDAVGKYSDKDIESMAFIAADPKHGASEQAVTARVVGVHAEAKTKAALLSFIQPYLKPLSKDGKRRVQSLLEEGDAASNAGGYGREFTYMEARSKGLNDVEALAYLASRQLRMAMYHIRNGEMVRHMHAMGMREIELMSAGVKQAGRDLSLDSAMSHTGTWLYDAVEKKTLQFTREGMEDAYKKGKRVVQLEHPVNYDGQLRQVMLVDSKVATTRDIKVAVGYRPGEFSRIYTDEYFIRMKRTMLVDGVKKDVTEVVRTAASQREADDFTHNVSVALGVLKNVKKGTDPYTEVEKLVGHYFDTDEFIKRFKDGEFEGFRALDSHYTRNQEEYLNGSVSEAISNGRLFTSKRSEKLLSTDASRPNTLGVFESLQAEIANVSRVSNINQWRETHVRRWMNTFGHLLPERTGNDVADFYAAAGAKFTRGDQESLFAERTHKYIMRQIGVRTDEENFYKHLTRRVTEKFFTGNESIEGVGAAIRKFSLLGFVRNVNFNLTLGMFNPAQLIVQANGAATAIALSPLHGLAAAKTFPLLRMALMSDNPEVWSWFGKVDKALFGNEKEFVQLVKAVRQTGIIDNTKSTSLYNLEDGALDIFGGYPSKIIGKSTFFFDRGEEFSRLVSFDVARREWTKANPGKDWSSKDALAAMVVRADDLTQNMTKANLARFQEGAISVPMQFAQYNIKLAMNVLTSLLGKGEGRGFSRTEAVQLLGAHVLLYGTAGAGIAQLMDEFAPKEVLDKMSVEAKTYMAQGLLSGLLNQVGEALTGERTNVALGTRLGSFNYYNELARALFTDPKNVYEALLGPSLSTARRLGVVGEVAALWKRDPDLTAEDVLRGFARMTTEQVASLRNVSKAYLFHLHSNKLLDKNGIPIAQLTPPEVLAQALGFQPTVMADVSNLIRSKKDHSEALQDVANLIFKVQRQIMDARARGDHAYADEQHKLLQALWPTNIGDFTEVQRIVRDRLFPYDNEFQKLLGDYVFKGHNYERPTVITTPPKKD